MELANNDVLHCRQCNIDTDRLYPLNDQGTHASEEEIDINGTEWVCESCMGDGMNGETGLPFMAPMIVHELGEV